VAFTRIHRADVARNAWHHPDRTGTTADAFLKRLGGQQRAEANAVLRAAIRFWEWHQEPTATLLNDPGLIRLQSVQTSKGHHNQKESKR